MEKTWQAQLGNCQNRNLHTSKIVCLLPVCHRNNRHLADRISEPYAVLWKMVTNCVRSRTIPDEIDTETEICTLLKSEFYFFFVDHQVQSQRWLVIPHFRFLWRSVEKYVHHNWGNWKMGILHTSKIGNLLPVSLRNNKYLTDHISKPYAKFYGKW